jgi:hypothetical protein
VALQSFSNAHAPGTAVCAGRGRSS